jgi:hypothetical protein
VEEGEILWKTREFFFVGGANLSFNKPGYITPLFG